MRRMKVLALSLLPGIVAPLLIASTSPGKNNHSVDQLTIAMTPSKEIAVPHIKQDIEAKDVDHALWANAVTVPIANYWSGEVAPSTRHATAQLLWSDQALYVRYKGQQNEPLVISNQPKTDVKTLGLWDRDVAEIFVGPNPDEPERYYEFEVAPTGEWVDLGIRQLADRRETNWDFKSGMTAYGRIDKGSVLMAMRIPWKGIGYAPKRGQRLRANLFRCIGSGENRGYLAWSPTRTAQPNFHVPSALGWLVLN
jgi:alpha-galactosidase